MLKSGEVSADSITPLVAVRFVGDDWVVFGNRRLKALQAFQEAVPERVCVHCIVHDLDGPQPVHHGLVAKFLDASTTENGGLFAEFRERRWRRRWRR